MRSMSDELLDRIVKDNSEWYYARYLEFVERFGTEYEAEDVKEYFGALHDYVITCYLRSVEETRFL